MKFTPTNLSKKSFIDLEKIFTSYFDLLALKHGYYYVFDHYLDSIINAFCFNYNEEAMNYIRNRYCQNERYVLGEMLKIWIKIMDLKITSDNDFFDWFGYYYEKNAMSKQQGFAQYFTPEHICKFMAMLVMNDNVIQENVYEPTCGSGRLNLSAHSINNKLFHVANDLDYTCAKMSALNFMIHGIRGIVTCDDALLPKSKFKGAFVINSGIVPSIQFIADVNEAYLYINNRIGLSTQNENKDLNKKESEINTDFIKDQFQLKADRKGQLALF